MDHEQATTFISELTEGVCGDRIPTFFMRGNHEIRNAYSIGLRDHFDYVGDKLMPLLTGEIPVSSCWIVEKINRTTIGYIMA